MARFVFNPALRRTAMRWVIGLVSLTVLVTLVTTILTSKKSLMEHLYDFPTQAVLWLLLATIVESVLRFWRYHTAAHALQLNVPLHRMAYYYTVGYALLPTPGKVGTAIRIWLLKEYHGLPYTRTAPLLAMDLVSDSLALCGLAVMGLMVIGFYLGDGYGLQAMTWLVGVAFMVGLLITLVAPQLLVRLINALYLAMGRRRPRLFARTRRLLRQTTRVLGWRVLLLTTTQSMVGWALVGWAIGHLVSELGVPLSMAQGSVVVSLGTMGGFLSMMPAGVGGAEATMVFLLTQFGAELSVAVLATALIRLFVVWVTVGAGLILLPFALNGTPMARAERLAKRAAR
jgi:uncharacterized membrane protein YbhN (UPF0104 family)